jgi:NADH-quinone oxidoreductase subunit L
MDNASLILPLLLPAIILFPFIGAISVGLFGRRDSRNKVTRVAIGAVAASFVLSCIAFVSLWLQRAGAAAGESVSISCDVYEWFSVYWSTASGESYAVPVRVRFVMDELSGVMTLFVTGIGLLIHIYSAGYMSEEPSYARFFAYLNLFMGSMLVLVLGSSLPVMFVGWEGVGLCSYLLIGFWWRNPTYAAAGRKAFVVNRIGDLGVIAGTLLLFGSVHSFEFASINEASATLAQSTISLGTLGTFSVATLACLCLFLGCTGKSAQLPLFVWLPDAMAGPTPVSALIHAATMVTAGVYLMCRLSPLFAVSPIALAVIASVGAITALVAASIALVQNQLKKVLAYSTVSQLGFMVAAVGVGAFGAGFFHVFTHAFFKACLFLGAGSVMHAVHAHGDADLRELGGLRAHLPITHATFLVSCLAIAGIPPFAGFFSKDEILLGAAHAQGLFPFAPWLATAVYATLTATAALTAFYMFRLYFMTFTGARRGGVSREHESGPLNGHASDDHASAHHDAGHGHEPHESPPSMTLPLVILAVGAAVAGWLGLPHALHLHNWWGEWLSPVLAHAADSASGHEGGGALEVMMMGTAAAVAGVAGAFAVYHVGGGKLGARLASAMPRVYRFLLDKWRLDELYRVLVVRPLEVLAELCSVVDKIVVDGILTSVTAATARATGFLLSRLQTGRTYTYATAVATGAAVVVWWFAYPHACMQAKAEGNQVTFELGQGRGYTYQWDLNADGSIEIPWDASIHTVRNTYAPESIVRSAKGVVLVVTPVGGSPSDAKRLRLWPGSAKVLDDSWLGSGWSASSASADAVPPAVRYDREGRFWFRANDAEVAAEIRGRSEVDIALGSAIVVGDRELRIIPLVAATGYVRNEFGSVRKTTKYVELDTLSAKKTPSPSGAPEISGGAGQARGAFHAMRVGRAAGAPVTGAQPKEKE